MHIGREKRLELTITFYGDILCRIYRGGRMNGNTACIFVRVAQERQNYERQIQDQTK